MPAGRRSRRCRRAGLVAVALALTVSGCSLGGGGDDEAQDSGDDTASAETGADVEALRAAWAEQVGAGCSERDEQIETVAQGLPGIVEDEGLAAAAEGLEPVEQTMVESLNQAAPAPGDEAAAQEMAALLQEAGELRAQAVAAKYVKRDRQYYALMRQSEAAREEAASIATELGADACAVEPPGPYGTVDGFAAVRWGDRASTICRERDRAFKSFRPTDAARFDAATRRWLKATRSLAPPEQYAQRIKRFLDQYAASEEAHDDAFAAYERGDPAQGKRLDDKGNRLSRQSSDLMYDIGFEIGYTNFCSAR